MPTEADLQKLAAAYLAAQRRLWPELARAGLFGRAADAGDGPDVATAAKAAEVDRLVADYKARHLGGALTAPPAAVVARFGRGDLYGAYLRYSDHDSNPRSIDDQLGEVLSKARQAGHLVPWAYVYADVETSGLIWGRRGYRALNALMADPGPAGGPLRGAYILDFSRGGRDPVEWFRFANRARGLRKNVIGAADGFVLESEHGGMMLHVYAMFQDFFVTMLKKKVRLGMSGAAERNTSTGRPPLGYGLVPKLGPDGRPVTGRDGGALNEMAIHEPTRPHVLFAFEARGERAWSRRRICHAFNRAKVDGSDGWTDRAVARLLANPTYIGVRIHNRSRQERCPETNRLRVVANPRHEWKVVRVPHLRLVSDDLWKKARRREHAARHGDPRTGRKRSRNEKMATTLFSGTLFCAHCVRDGRPREIVLSRSAGPYQCMACQNGLQGVHGCRLTTNKSVRLIEECLLGSCATDC